MAPEPSSCVAADQHSWPRVRRVSTRIAVVSDWSHLRPLLERMGNFEDDGLAHARFETIIRSHEHLLVLASEGHDSSGTRGRTITGRTCAAASGWHG